MGEVKMGAGEVAELMAQHEEAIGKLYKTYAKYLSNKQIWQWLAKEEEYHAAWIRSFNKNVLGNQLVVDDRFYPEMILQSIKHIENQIAEARNRTEEEALGIALEIENMVLEKNVLDILDNGSPRVGEIISKLKQGTEGHSKRIEETLKDLIKMK